MKKMQNLLIILFISFSMNLCAQVPTGEHYLSISHEVSDYAKWEKVYDQFNSDREKSGIVELFVKKNINNTNSVTIFSKVADLNKAKAFMASATLQEAMKNGGVTSPPEVVFYTSAAEYGAIQSSSLVTTITHSVADFSSWKKTYDSVQEVRENPVLLDHLILRSLSDENVITVLGTSKSAAKFDEFISSSKLKEIMGKAGVTSKPEVNILF